MADNTSPSTVQPDAMAAAKRRYTFIVAGTGAVLILLIQNPFFPLAMRLMFLAMVMLGLIRWSAAILLVLIQLDLYISVPAFGAYQEPPGLIIAFVTIILLAALSRLRSSQELTGIRSATELITSTVRSVVSPGPLSPGESDQDTSQGSAAETFWIAARSLAFVLLAAGLLQLYPLDRDSVRDYGLTPAGLRSLQIGLLLFTGYILLTLPLTELQWKRLTPDQAGIYLRSRFTGWIHRDLRAVERRRRRLRKKQARARRRHNRDSYLQYSEKAD